MVVTAIARQSETPMIVRVGNSTIYAHVTAEIWDTTGTPEVLVDSATMPVSGYRVDHQPLASTAWFPSGINRDFFHNFIVDTVAAHTYAVRFTLTCGADDQNNYILWASDLRQVFWNIYKR
jgi:hypothetical protein